MLNIDILQAKDCFFDLIEQTIAGNEIIITKNSKPVVRITPADYGKEKSCYDITQTRTWQLCGSLEIAEPEIQYTMGHDEKGQIITNYAENVDGILTEDNYA